MLSGSDGAYDGLVPEDVTLHAATFADLDAATLYALLRLRVDVFVVEQECAYPELDGRDTDPVTVHLWLARGGEPLAYLRILGEPDGADRISRVMVAKHARGRGHARRLMNAAFVCIGGRQSILHAQAHLVDFYAGMGFTPTGPEFLQDGIPHIPMHRPGAGRPAAQPAPDGG